MRKSGPLRLVLAVLLTGISSTGTVAVSGTIVATCSIAGSTLAFGTYDPIVANLSSPLAANGSALSVSCTRGATGVSVQLDAGANGTHAIGTTRAMASGANYLSYELYTTSGLTTVWNTTNTISYAPTSMAATSLTVYGNVPGGQDAFVANYTDSVTATVNF
jgi:spore coat protein U-like protein